MISTQDQLLLSNAYVDEGTVDGTNEDVMYFTDRVVSVMSFRNDVWLGYLTGVDNVTTGFSMEISRFQLGGVYCNVEGVVFDPIF